MTGQQSNRVWLIHSSSQSNAFLFAQRYIWVSNRRLQSTWCLVELKQNHSSRKLTLSILLNREVLLKWPFWCWALLIKTRIMTADLNYSQEIPISSRTCLWFDNCSLVYYTLTPWKAITLWHPWTCQWDLFFQLCFLWDFSTYLFVVMCTC